MSNRSPYLVLIPSYNTGPILLETVTEVLQQGFEVWVVVDGSTDGSADPLDALAAANPLIRVVRRQHNGGKGEAVLTGAREAIRAGFTHALVMDADGQHPADRIADFFEASQKNPYAMVLGRPVFGAEAPVARLYGRKLSVGLVHFEIFGSGIDDPLFGFRVYPLKPLVEVMSRIGGARRYDFDPEIAVRLFWAGTPTLNLAAACRYRSREDGGVSHFHYVRDNVRMVWLHTKLIFELLFMRWPAVRRIRRERLPLS